MEYGQIRMLLHILHGSEIYRLSRGEDLSGTETVGCHARNTYYVIDVPTRLDISQRRDFTGISHGFKEPGAQ